MTKRPTKKPSILFLNRVYPPDFGATGQMLYDLARHLNGKGHQVSILTSGQKKQTSQKGGIKIYAVKAPKNHKTVFGFLMLWGKLLSAALEIPKHDIVVSLTDPPFLVKIGNMYAAKYNVTHLHWCHDVYPDLLKPLGISLPRPLAKYLFLKSRQWLKATDHIIPISNCMARYLMKSGVSKTSLTPILNWSSMMTATGLRESYAAKTKQLMPDKDIRRNNKPKFRVLYAGHIARAHLIDPIIQAADDLQEHEEIEFTFVCQKEAHDYIVAERQRRCLENIRLIPLQPAHNILPILETGDVHLVTMRPQVEGMLLPSKFFASIAVARPVVFLGPDQNDIAQIIQHYQMGDIVLPKNHAKLSDVIYQYRADGDKWFMAQEGAAKAAQDYSFLNSMAAWDTLLSKKDYFNDK